MLEITLKQMETFVEIAICGSFSEAAEKLYMSQPAVSSQIAALESRLGVTLLERGSRKKVVLTPRGREIFLQCSSIVQSCKELESTHEAESAELRIGASTVPMEFILPPIMADFRTQNPKCSFLLQKGNSSTVHEMMQKGEVQLGFVGTVIDRQNLFYRRICSDRLILVTANTAQYRRLKAAGTFGRALFTQPMIVRTQGSGTQLAVDRYFSETGVPTQDIRVVARIESNEAILQSVSQNLGVAVVSELVAKKWLDGGKLLGFALEEKPIERELYLIYPKYIHPSGLVQRFADFTTEYAKTRL